MIAKALAQQTRIIILDEPTAFLDFPSKIETLQMLRRLAHEQHKSILLSTHDVELALQLSDRLWLMEESRFSIGTLKNWLPMVPYPDSSIVTASDSARIPSASKSNEFS